MQKKQVAIIDIGSSSITSVLGERGVNNTFLLKGKYSYEHDGFGDGVFYDEDKLTSALTKAVADLKSASGKGIEVVYVGVPGEFTKVVVKDSQISFAKKKKITEADVDALYDSAFVGQSSKFSLMNHAPIVYELDDFRRFVSPVGYTSEIFKGRLSFVLGSNYFLQLVGKTIKRAGVKRIEFVSIALAEALYLVDDNTRDKIALIVDIGYITTTVSVIQGDGILYQQAFSYGGGFITGALTEKFDIDFAEAEIVKRKANLSSIEKDGSYDVIEGVGGALYNAHDVKEIMLYSLDTLCEKLSEIIDKLNLPEYVSLMITGGGISYLRGAKEYVSNRLNTVVEIIAPPVPMMSKPDMSSILSLLDLALKQPENMVD